MAANRRQRRTAGRSRSPDSGGNTHATGKRHHAFGNFAVAESGYAEALKINNKNTSALIGLAQFKIKQGDNHGAMHLLTKAIRIDPRLSVARFLLGNVFAAEKANIKAIQQFRQCVRLEPDNMQYLWHLAEMWRATFECSKAAECYARFVAVVPDNAAAYNNLGVSNMKECLIGAAIVSLRRALELEPSNATIRSNLLQSLNYSPTLSRQSIFEEHSTIGLGFPFSRSAPPIRSDPPLMEARGRLRIGFMSPDFRNHSVSYFFEPLLSELDRTGFDTFCYAEVQRPDETTARLQGMADHWYSTVGKSDEAVVAKIRDDRIDILIDLAGHTTGNRLPVFAMRAAPVQATWLGYPNTTGLPAMDFRITDAICDPIGDADDYSTEALIRLPDGFLCYQENPVAPEIVSPPSLSKGFITFGSFNNPAKINEDVVALWAGVMRRVPDSRLLLKFAGLQEPAVIDRIGSWFASNGVKRKRLTFKGISESLTEHLGLYGLIDVALDTYPYNGTTTSCEALWMGVPIVSLHGDSCPSLVGASLLNQLDMPELATANEEEYIAIACDLAENIDRLTGLRRDLRGRMRKSKLMDRKNFAHQMEAAFHQMLQIKSST